MCDCILAGNWPRLKSRQAATNIRWREEKGRGEKLILSPFLANHFRCSRSFLGWANAHTHVFVVAFSFEWEEQEAGKNAVDEAEGRGKTMAFFSFFGTPKCGWQQPRKPRELQEEELGPPKMPPVHAR
jgi:hypothetical protein